MTDPTTPLAALNAAAVMAEHHTLDRSAILAALDKLGWILVRKGEPSEAQVEAAARIIAPSAFAESLSRTDGTPTGGLKHVEREHNRERARAKAREILSTLTVPAAPRRMIEGEPLGCPTPGACSCPGAVGSAALTTVPAEPGAKPNE